MTIVTLQEYLMTTQSPLIDENSISYSLVPSFITDENTHFLDNLKEYMIINYGGYNISQDYADSLSVIRTRLTYMYACKKYTLQGLYDSTQFEYNPIENYSMTEKGKDANSGTDTTTDNIGATKTSQNTGSRADQSQYGKQTNTNTHDVSPENAANFIAQSRDTYDNGTHLDTYTQGEQSNTVSTDATENQSKLEHGHVLEHELKRSGNVGVTTSQQMLASERDIVQFNIYKTVAELIIKIICDLVWTDF